MAFDPTAYDWSKPYNQWAPEQTRQANAFLSPQLASGNYTGIIAKAKELGIDPTTLSNAAFASTSGQDPMQAGAGSGWADYLGQYYRDSGWGKQVPYDPNKAANWQGYGYNDQQQAAMKALFPQFDPRGTTPFKQYLTNNNVNTQFGMGLVNNWNPQDPAAAFTAAQQAVQDRFMKEFGPGDGKRGDIRRAASGHSGMDEFNRMMSGGRGVQRRMNEQWGGVGGILGGFGRY